MSPKTRKSGLKRLEKALKSDLSPAPPSSVGDFILGLMVAAAIWGLAFYLTLHPPR